MDTRIGGMHLSLMGTTVKFLTVVAKKSNQNVETYRLAQKISTQKLVHFYSLSLIISLQALNFGKIEGKRW